MIRIILPTYLQRLANVGREVEIEIEGDITISSILDAIETNYPMLKGTIRDHISGERRPYLRYFACGEDFSHLGVHATLPDKISRGEEVFRIIGAMSGG